MTTEGDKQSIPPATAREDIWAGYDPERVRKALRAVEGLLHGVDRDQLLADIREQRGHLPNEDR